MAFPTNDGKKKGSRFAANKFNQHHPVPSGEGDAPKAHESDTGLDKPNPKMQKEESRTTSEGEAKSSKAQQVLSEHGKASHVHLSHDFQASKHHVHSVHADGHVHDEDFPDHQSAHRAARMLGGADEQQPQEQAQEQGEGGFETEPDGFSMPRLA